MKRLAGVLVLLVGIGVFAPLSLQFDGGVSVVSSHASAQGFFDPQDGETVGGEAIADSAGDGDKFAPSVCPKWLDFGCQLGFFFIYTIFFRFSAWLASLVGGLTDFLIWLSIQGSIYHNSEFINRGWTILRDIVNIGFIAGLLYAAFSFIVGKEGVAKKILGMVIVLALGINFSLFISKVIVDGGNILARSIYESIDTVGVKRDYIADEGAKEITVALVRIMNPQKLVLDANNPFVPQPGDPRFLSAFLFVYFVAGVVNILLIGMFLQVSLLFVARTIGLMLLMILVPVTIIPALLPMKAITDQAAKYKYLNISGWASEIFNLSLVAPVYMFFVYLIALFWQATTQGTVLQIGAEDTLGWIAGLIAQLIPFVMTWYLMKMAVAQTKSLAGTLGGEIAAAAGAAGGALLGATFALVGGLGATVIGGGVGKLLQSGGANAAVSLGERRKKTEEERVKLRTLKTKQSSGQTLTAQEQADLTRLSSAKSRIGRTLSGAANTAGQSIARGSMKAGTTLRTTSFDVRNAPALPGVLGGGTIAGALKGAGFGSYKGYGGLMETYPPTKGGYDSMTARIAEREADRIKKEADLIEKVMAQRGEAERRANNQFESKEGEENVRAALKKERESYEKGGVSVNGNPADDQRAVMEGSNINNSAGTAPVSGTIRDLEKKIEEAEARITALKKAKANSGGTFTQQADLDRELLALKGDGVTTFGLMGDMKREKSHYESALRNAAVSQSLVVIDAAITEANKKNDTIRKEILEKIKSERDAKLKEVDDMLKSESVVRNQSERYTAVRKNVESINKQMTTLATNGLQNSEQYRKLDKDLQKLQGTMSTLEAVGGGIVKQHADNMRTLERYKKEASEYRKSFVEQEIQLTTNWGRQLGQGILKGLAVGLVTGGAGALAGGLTSAFTGVSAGTAVLGSIGTGAAAGLVGGVGYGTYKAGQSIAGSAQSRLYTEYSYAQNIRNNLRSAK